MPDLKLIRRLASERKITLRQLAERAHLDESSIQVMFRRNSTTLATLEKICNVLEVHPGIFFDNEYGSRPEAELIQEIKKLKKKLEEKDHTIEVLMKRIDEENSRR